MAPSLAGIGGTSSHFKLKYGFSFGEENCNSFAELSKLTHMTLPNIIYPKAQAELGVGSATFRVVVGVAEAVMAVAHF